MTEVIKGLSNDEYHQREAISKSGLDAIAKSPLHFWDRYLNPEHEPFKQTPAMIIGEATHTMVLEPNEYDNRMVVMPEFNTRTKAGKEEAAQWKEVNSDLVVITKENHELACNLTEAVRNNTEASEYLSGFGDAEDSYFWEWKLDGTAIPCRCRPDFVREDGVVVDLKTSLTAAPKGFKYHALKLRYDVQTTFYSEGYKAIHGEYPKAFVFVVVEKYPPYPVSVFHAETEEWYTGGHARMMADLQTYADCLRTDIWPGYESKGRLVL